MLPADVTNRHEFLSDGWIEVARRYLEDAVQREPALRDGDFSLCESFTDAPPELQLPGDRAVWHFQVRGGRVDVGRGDLADPTLRIDGDYQTTLAMAQTEPTMPYMRLRSLVGVSLRFVRQMHLVVSILPSRVGLARPS